MQHCAGNGNKLNEALRSSTVGYMYVLVLLLLCKPARKSSSVVSTCASARTLADWLIAAGLNDVLTAWLVGRADCPADVWVVCLDK